MAVKVSVCIPVYNCEPYIKECIDSVLNQSMQDFEIIVLNNKSTDKTVDVVKQYNDSRISISSNDSNIGMIGNWNKVMTMAKGDYIKLLPADDFIYPDCLKQQCDVLDQDKNERISLVCGRKNVIKDNGKVMGTRGFSRWTKEVSGKVAINKTVRSAGNIIGEPGAVMFRRTILQKAGQFESDNLFTADLNLWFKMLLYGNLYALSTIVYAFRLQKDSVSVSIVNKHKNDLKAFMNKIYTLKEFGLTPLSLRIGLMNSVVITLAKRLLYKSLKQLN